MSEHRTGDYGPEALPNQPGLEVRPKSRHDYNYESVNSYYRGAYSAPRKRGSLFCGMSDGALGFLIGVLCSMVVVGASVGGGLGSRLASCEGRIRASMSTASTSSSGAGQVVSATMTSSGPTTSATGFLTDYAPPAASVVETLQNNCSASTVSNIWGDKYVIACGLDYQQGAPTAEGGLMANLAAIYAYSFDDCLSACSGMNSKTALSDLGVKCRSVTFGFDMRNSSDAFWSNCWMKNGTMQDPAIAFKDVHRISAKLVA